MSFYLEDSNSLNGVTVLTNLFIENFLPDANGTYVKIYIYALKKATEGIKTKYSNRDLAMDLKLSMEDVDMAWDHWEKVGVIRKIYDGGDYSIEILNLTANKDMPEDEEIPDESVELDHDVERLLQATEIPEINNMFNSIDYIFRRETTSFEKSSILSWIMDNNMNPDVIEQAFLLASKKKSRLNVNYVGGIIKNWYTQGITNMEALEEYLKLNDERAYEYKHVMKGLGAVGNITEQGMKIVDKWRDDYGFSMELIDKALENSTKTNNPNLNYIDAIVSDWFEKGITSPDQVKNIEKPEISVKNTNVKTSANNKFHNFEQRTDGKSPEELEAMWDRKRKEYIEGDFN